MHVWDKSGLSGYLVHLVDLVHLVYPVSLVRPNKLDKPNKPIKRDRPDRPNRPNEQDRLADFFSILLGGRFIGCIVGGIGVDSFLAILILHEHFYFMLGFF
jgi:hypothetical protein